MNHLTDSEILSASCRDMDIEIFYVDETDHRNRKAIKSAKAICQQCPIRFRCLEIAIANEEFGIWGGTTERDRKRMMRNHASKKALNFSREQVLAGNRTAALNSATKAAQKMNEEFSKKEIGDNVPEITRKLIILRLENPTASFTQLGLLMSPPLTKNQVAGKLRRALSHG